VANPVQTRQIDMQELRSPNIRRRAFRPWKGPCGWCVGLCGHTPSSRTEPACSVEGRRNQRRMVVFKATKVDGGLRPGPGPSPGNAVRYEHPTFQDVLKR